MRVSLFNHIQSWPPWHQNHKCDRPQNSMEPSILDVNDFDSSTSIFINLFFGWLNILRVPSIDAKKCFHYFRRHHHVDCVSELDVAQQNPQTSAKKPEKPMVFPWKTYGVPMKNPRFSHEKPTISKWMKLGALGARSMWSPPESRWGWFMLSNGVNAIV